MRDFELNWLASPLARLGTALEASGFRRLPGGKFQLDTALGPRVKPVLAGSGWLRLTSSSLRLPGPPPRGSRGEEFLREELAPPGPFRLTPVGPPGIVRLVADLPLSLVEAGEEADAGLEGSVAGAAPSLSRRGLDVHAGDLAASLAAFADRRPESVDPAPAPAAAALAPDEARERFTERELARSDAPGRKSENGAGGSNDLDTDSGRIVERLAGRGWVSAVTGGQTHVNLQGAGTFHQVWLRRDTAGRHRLDLEVADLGGWPEPSFAATVAVARRAAERLRLARLVLRRSPEPGGGERRLLLAQVHLGSHSLESAWLDLGLQALQAAAAALAGELQALADPVLAKWVRESLECSIGRR